MFGQNRTNQIKYLYESGEGNRKSGEYQAAIKFYTEVICLDNSHFDAYVARGLALNALQRTKEAIHDFTIALTWKQDAFVHFYRGTIYHKKLHDYPSALREYKQAIKYSTTSDYKLIIDAHIACGEVYHETNHLSKAIGAFKSALKRHSANAIACSKIAFTYQALGELDRAIVHFSQVIDLFTLFGEVSASPKLTTEAYTELGHIYRRLGRTTLAMEYYKAACKLVPSHEVYYFLGLTCLNSGAFAEAIDHFNLSGKNKKVLLNRGIACLALAAYKTDTYSAQGLSDFNYNIQKDFSASSDVYLHRGMALQRWGCQEEIISDFLSAWKLPGSLTIKLFSGLQLHELKALPEEEIDLTTLVNKVAMVYNETSRMNGLKGNAEKLCLLALGQHRIGQVELANQSYQTLICKFLPNAIPVYLRESFITLLTKLTEVSAIEFKENLIPEYKDQFVTMIINTNNKNIQINAALQALCSKTPLGHILYFRNATLYSGKRLERLALYLDNHLLTTQDIVLTQATKQALKGEAEQEPAFVQTLQKKYPHIFETITPYLSHYTPRLFSEVGSPTSKQPLIQSKHGNRFIPELNL